MSDQKEGKDDKGAGQESKNELNAPPKEPPKDPEKETFRRPSSEDGTGRQPPPSRYIQTTEDDKSTKFEKCAVFICWILFLIGFPFSLCCCITVVPEYARLIILRLGRLRRGIRGPGLVFYFPCIDDVRAVDMRTEVTNVRPQDVLTKDSVTITVDDAQQATQLISQVTLRNVVGTKTLNVLLTSRQQLSKEIQHAVAEITARWGVRVERVDVMDIILPSSLERSLASEAEAVREARAKLILAEGELKASKALKEASDVMSENKITLQLRHLQVLSSIAAERRVRIIYPIPLEIMEPFLDKSKDKGKDDGGDGGKDGEGKDKGDKNKGGKDSDGKDSAGKDSDGKDKGGKDSDGKDSDGKDSDGKDSNGKDTGDKDTGGSNETRKEGGEGEGFLSHFFFNEKVEPKPKIEEDDEGDPNVQNSAKTDKLLLSENNETRHSINADLSNQRPTYVAVNMDSIKPKLSGSFATDGSARARETPRTSQRPGRTGGLAFMDLQSYRDFLRTRW
ncbi:band 7 protein AAEL010189 isoform X2 [Drosophila ficusphila]|uniref:band 7 protein AAEL010189 isoform X2 n=1 Tax=Drosophila ficusphila TaxID=30025 RepID=UPI0007E87790|nr:band 7 protein AAEL010189 isoform X2 [Drosophila ficusphila]